MFEVKIETGNAAFQDGDAGSELARILRDIADKLEDGGTRIKARDINGNTVGLAVLEEDDSDEDEEEDDSEEEGEEGSEPTESPRFDVELVGQDGNAFGVIGLCQKAMKRQGATKEDVTAFQAEAMAGDYTHLLNVVQKWFRVS